LESAALTGATNGLILFGSRVSSIRFFRFKGTKGFFVRLLIVFHPGIQKVLGFIRGFEGILGLGFGLKKVQCGVVLF
jgi:hypothetical protein